MLATLFGKLATAVVATSTAFSVIVVVILERSHKAVHLELNQRLHRDIAVQLLGEAVSLPLELQAAAVLNRARQISIANPRLSAFVVRADGTVLDSSAPPELIVRRVIDLGPVLEFVRGAASWPMTADDPLAEKGRTIFSAAPFLPGADTGYLYVTLDRALPAGIAGGTEPESTHSLRGTAWLLIGNMAVALLAALIAIRLIVNPLARLRSAMEAFERSGYTGAARYSTGSKTRGTDEIRRLGRIFDSMAGRISAQLEALRRTDSDRRELYASISHDLRTPLTSLRGYLDTLASRRELSEADRLRYLGIVQRQAAILSQLVDQALQLAELESPELQASRQPVELDGLIADVLATMHPVFAAKQLVLQSASCGGGRVHADAPLLGRAVRNVLQNAAQWSPPGGHISVEVRREGEDALVAVSDEGPGFTGDELNRGFRRLARGARAADQEGGWGLGLAIVRRIMVLHDGDVTLRNLPGGGAVVSLRLRSTNAGG